MSRSQIEGTARVVKADGDTVWLEPDTSASCGSCMSASVCGHRPGSGRLAARRFSMANEHGLRLGDRVVVGIGESSLLRASLTAYGLPLVGMLGGGVTAQALGAGDGVSALATLGGLALGLGAVRLAAKLLTARGDLSPRYLRHAQGPGPDEACHTL